MSGKGDVHDIPEAKLHPGGVRVPYRRWLSQATDSTRTLAATMQRSVFFVGSLTLHAGVVTSLSGLLFGLTVGLVSTSLLRQSVNEDCELMLLSGGGGSDLSRRHPADMASAMMLCMRWPHCRLDVVREDPPANGGGGGSSDQTKMSVGSKSNLRCVHRAQCSSLDVEACKRNGDCLFEKRSGRCEAQFGYGAGAKGVLAAAPTVGGMLGCLLATVFTAQLASHIQPGSPPTTSDLEEGQHAPRHLLHRNMPLLVGIRQSTEAVGVTGALLFFLYVTTYRPSVELLGALLFLLGVATGSLTALAPTFVATFASAHRRTAAGSLFQFLNTLGISLPPCLAWLAGVNIAASGGCASLVVVSFVLFVWIEGLLNFACGGPSVLPAPTDGSGGVVPNVDEIPSSTSLTVAAATTAVLIVPTIGDGDGAPTSVLDRRCRGALLLATVLAVAQQLTGINAVLVFAPQLAHDLGLSKLQGSAVITLWNCVSCGLALPFVRRLRPGPIYVWACLGQAVASFVLAHTIMRHAASQWVAVAIGAYIACFEVGMGPMFYVIATNLFDPAVRVQGCAVTNMLRFLFNIVINFGFPLVMSRWYDELGSVEAAENRAYNWFGVIGVASVAILAAFLTPDGRLATPAAREGSDDHGAEHDECIARNLARGVARRCGRTPRFDKS